MRMHITQFSVPTEATNLDMPSKSLNVNYIKGQHKMFLCCFMFYLRQERNNR